MKRISLLLLLLLSFTVTPIRVNATVRISEIAWMGTVTSANNEWIELWNDGAEAVDLTGWTLKWGESGTSPKTVSLSGSIPAGAYYLLERSDDDTVVGISADLIYVGALSNGGEKITLYNGAIFADAVDAASGWPAGDNENKNSMQLVSGVFKTMAPTPRSSLSSNDPNQTTATTSISTNTTKSSTTTTTAAESTNSGQNSSSSQSSSHSSPWPLSDRDEPIVLQVSAGRNRLSTIETPVQLEGRAWMGKSELPTGVTYRWSFGDGGNAVGKSVRHSYSFPGNYAVVLNAEQGTLHATARTKIKIVPLSIAISLSKEGGIVRLTMQNEGKEELNLGGWKVSGVLEKKFPEDTIVESKGALILPLDIIEKNAMATGTISLVSPDGMKMKELAIAPNSRLVPSRLENHEIATSTFPEIKRLLSAMEDDVKKLLLQKESRENHGTAFGPRLLKPRRVATVLVRENSAHSEDLKREAAIQTTLVLPKTKERVTLWQKIIGR